MKCRYLAAMLLVNPAWNQVDADAAQSAGIKYDVPQRIKFDAGYVIEDHQAWINCCPGDLNSPPIAEPADDECVEATRQWMEEMRPAAIRVIKEQLAQIDLLENATDKKRLLAMGRAYGLIGGQPASAATPVKATTVEVAPVEAAPVAATPVEVAPVEIAPVDAAPVDAAT